MTTHMSEKEVYEQAEKRVKQKQGFYVHLTVYICVNIILVLIWTFPAGRGFPWFIFPIVGWGIAVLLHGLGVYGSGRKSDRAAIDKEAEKIRREQM